VVRGGWEVSDRRSSAGLTLTDCTPVAKRLVKGVDALPVPFGRAVREGTTLVVGSGPCEWTLLGGTGPPHDEDMFVSLIDITHGRALVRLTGAEAANALAKVCAIDLSDRVTPDGSAFRSSVAEVVTDVVRDDIAALEGSDDGADTPSYLLHCERSSGQFLFDALLDAGAEFGIEPTGGDLR